jgi:hypothetical protein
MALFSSHISHLDSADERIYNILLGWIDPISHLPKDEQNYAIPVLAKNNSIGFYYFRFLFELRG